MNHPDGPGKLNVLDVLADFPAIFRLMLLKSLAHKFPPADGTIETT